MRPFYKLPRLYIDAPLRKDDELALDKMLAHHLIHVLRLKAGAEILLFNGQDGEWLAAILDISKKHITLHVKAQTKPQSSLRKGASPPDLVYCFAPLKSARLDYMVQKATEMGAAILQPVITQFTQNPHINLEKMRAHVIEAAQQCGLTALPMIAPVLTLPQLLSSWPEQQTQKRRLIFCDEMLAEEETNPLTLLQQLAPSPLALLIGPEGGFSDDERALLKSKAFVTAIGLGERILRADTAAVAAMALINVARMQQI